MQKLMAAALIFVGCGWGGWTVYQQTRTAPVEIVIGEESDEITFLCTETGAVTRGPWAATPAVNPQTGRKTLQQGMYCSLCHKWYPAPPPEMARQTPRGPSCPVDNSALSTDGPLAAQK